MYLSSFFGPDDLPHPCAGCGQENRLDFDVRMAFQPIVDATKREIYSYEALVRGMNGEGAGVVIGRLREEQRYRFDQTCRVKAIATAAALGMTTRLSINFMPNAVYQPATCIRLTLAAAERTGFPADKLIFEVTESEQLRDARHVVGIIKDYQRRGFLTAIDDFGAGYAGLTMLADLQPNEVKLDIALTREIDRDPVRRAITDGIVRTCKALGCTVVAEGVETAGQYRALRDLGVELFQGFLFARPALEALPQIDPALWSALEA